MLPKLSQKRLKELEQYVRSKRDEHYFSKEKEDRSSQDIEIKEICTNVLAWCILINDNE